MSDPLTDPADLWPSPPTAKRGEPQRWVWAAMEPPERRLRMRELAGWVDWLRTTFELHNQITHCWYLHSAVVEHLTALYAGWMRTYVGEEGPARELAEADWINTLHAFTPRFQLAACATGRHQEAPPVVPPPPGADEAFEMYLSVSETITMAAVHPAAAELGRREAALNAPL
ncbi:hypothetical protein OG429_29025 [Streptomyces sp. NBC_00190]|uniref:hypothetical protein n=1 Tax=unclassified Streptomyces TaxID=2593676 RepID=UPI002E2CB8AD|nr:hypothetical protein [Streptomyces sp. NBC_00190]